jgi:ABC-2 type transport system ATP-binding protein
VITVTNLVRRYGDKVAVHDLSFEVGAGECVAILGPNGAGKSTTIEILEGFRHRDSGEVRVLGVDPQHGDRAWRARVGIVPQGATDLGDLTVGEVVAYHASLYPHARGIEETLALTGLIEQREQRCGRLSGGQRRRVDVALGIVGRPELLFLDEPTTGFDPEARHVFWDVIRSLRSEGTTIVLTTHYLDEADQLADRVVVIAGGRKLADTTPDALGVRDGASATVSWREQGIRHERVTTTPSALLRELLARHDGEVDDLEVASVSLETAYLKLIAGVS